MRRRLRTFPFDPCQKGKTRPIDRSHFPNHSPRRTCKKSSPAEAREARSFVYRTSPYRSKGTRAVIRPPRDAPGVRPVEQAANERQIMRAVTVVRHPFPLDALVGAAYGDGVLDAV